MKDEGQKRKSFFRFRFGFRFFFVSLQSQTFGEVLEWLKRHAWKACNRQNRFAGSNPVLSAK